MRLFLTNIPALAAVLSLRLLAKATEAVDHLSILPVVPHTPYIGPRNDSGSCLAGHSSLNFTIQNNQDNPIFFYVTGKEPADDSFVVLRKQGDCHTWSTKPTYTDISSTMPYYFVDGTDGSNDFHGEIEVNSSISFMLPSYVNSARLYVSQDKLRFGTNLGGPDAGFVEPSATNPGLPEYNITWQFIEFTYGSGNFIVNPSYVDFAAMSLDLTLTSGTAGANVSTVRGLETNALKNICEDLNEQTRKDNQSWTNLCLTDSNGRYIRALSPSQYLALHPNDKMFDYYKPYVDRVWTTYKDRNLTINTQDDGSNTKVAVGRTVTCRVNPEDELLWCGQIDSSSGPYSFRKPTTAEIMGCTQGSWGENTMESPFTVKGDSDFTQALIVPRLCAAFSRSTLLLEGGDYQPSSKIKADLYYAQGDDKNSITNHYSRIVHDRLLDKIGYAFPYDDTNASDGNNTTINAGGVIQDPDPRLLLIAIR